MELFKRNRGKMVKYSGGCHIIVSQDQNKKGEKFIHIKFSRPLNRRDFCYVQRLNRRKSSGNLQYLHHGRVITELLLSEKTARVLCPLLTQEVIRAVWLKKKMQNPGNKFVVGVLSSAWILISIDVDFSGTLIISNCVICLLFCVRGSFQSLLLLFGGCVRG